MLKATVACHTLEGAGFSVKTALVRRSRRRRVRWLYGYMQFL